MILSSGAQGKLEVRRGWNPRPAEPSLGLGRYFSLKQLYNEFRRFQFQICSKARAKRYTGTPVSLLAPLQLFAAGSRAARARLSLAPTLVRSFFAFQVSGRYSIQPSLGRSKCAVGRREEPPARSLCVLRPWAACRSYSKSGSAPSFEVNNVPSRSNPQQSLRLFPACRDEHCLQQPF